MGVDSPHPVYTFPELDRDNNQLVTREEFLDLYTEATVSDFQKIDRDDSGTIDPQEWERFLEQHREPEPEYRSRQLIPHMRGPVYDPTTPPFPE